MTQQFVTGTSHFGVSSTSLPAALAEAELQRMELNLIREHGYHGRTLTHTFAIARIEPTS